MALNIKNAEVEKLADEVARLARETKTDAIRRALLERRDRLKVQGALAPRGQRLQRLLRDRVWPHVPADVLGVKLSREEQADILGFGPEGV